MKSKLSRWGNSYALRVPRHVVEEMQLGEESELLLQAKGNSLLFTKPSKEEQLQHLLEKISKQTELDWGAARGKEIW